MSLLETLQLQTGQQIELLDITAQVQAFVRRSGCREGLLCVYAPHTTAGITVNENADPAVRHDIEEFLRRRIPQESYFRHSEGNSPAHILSSLITPQQTFIIHEGALRLGTWQSIYFCEGDGPRSRQVLLKILPG